MIKTWRRCRNKYGYRFVELIELRRPKLQLVRGTMIGKCLDILAHNRVAKKKLNWRDALKPFRDEYEKMFAAEQEMYGDPIGEAERIVARYEQIYANDGLKYETQGGNPFELPVRVDLGQGIVFTGHIDKMPRDKQGRVWDMDHKTHKKIPDPEDRFHDLQQLMYMWAMPLSGYPKPSGVIWDYIRTKPPAIPEQLKKGGLTQRQNIDTDFDTYMAEIQRYKLSPRDYSEILNKLKLRGHSDFYQRVFLPTPNDPTIKTVVEDAKRTSLEMRALGGIDRTRTMDWTCKTCEYKSICQAELRGLDPEFIRKSEYQQQKDPRHIHLMEEDI